MRCFEKVGLYDSRIVSLWPNQAWGYIAEICAETKRLYCRLGDLRNVGTSSAPSDFCGSVPAAQLATAEAFRQQDESLCFWGLETFWGHSRFQGVELPNLGAGLNRPKNATGKQLSRSLLDRHHPSAIFGKVRGSGFAGPFNKQVLRFAFAASQGIDVDSRRNTCPVAKVA